ncbi:mechanosensitive ion channel family protein [Antarcticimicrobium sediminis]|uniref:Small-conductance mechanosensitive channel n=1 Tax=Antarcticimicrobium sediminis TaxID=2546227 RepID=A0A4R5EFN7_9RHOB|nr:mechanosensitive ion channel family protein [Antarcticimicrobium sediminis]TDE33062.1 mechanosensitive ion channel family protein [Antarcticimicrobium sediminis]
MTAKQHAKRLIWPTLLAALSFGLILFGTGLAGVAFDNAHFDLALTALAYFAAAWLISRILALALDQAAARSRPYPRLLKDLIAAALFLVAFTATVSLYLGQGALGALAGSGLILAMLGFAIRNVVADTLSGVALGIEGPFRIGDWIDIDTLARGRVIEIGWRTTRILTRDATYMILPNSQIARQRITNYSAPKPQYRAQVTLTLDHALPVEEARRLILHALQEAKLIQKNPAPDVKILAYEEGGITYAVRYWLSRFDRDIDCRDEVYSLIDEALRCVGTAVPHRRIKLVTDDPFLPPNRVLK